MKISGMQKTTLVDYPGHMATILFTAGCNFCCPYCQNKDLVINAATTGSYSKEEIFSHLNKRRGIIEGVVISGGEPTLHPDLPDFIAEIKNLGYLVKLDTNGSNPLMLKSLVENKLIDYVAMDIKNQPQKYGLTIGKDDFDIKPILESVDYLLSDKIDYEFRTTVPVELFTENDIDSIGKWINGAKKYYLQPYQESEGVINPIFSTPDAKTIDNYLEILRSYIPEVACRGLN
ncbi:MAG: anaerobic ribonucleoside-triphosphate reductase activating protein [Lachnospiraceae bacterium]|nr:anaerobic ribonucleoside-triphosphate reductase activating protein [Lachnospiraceae bacterium]